MQRKPVEHPSSFILITASVFSVLTFVLFMLDVVPESPVDVEDVSIRPALGPSTEVAQVTPIDTTPKSAVPVRIVIDSVNIATTVVTPASTEAEVLDRALLSGAVHYPGSVGAGEKGNMLLFGHSSYLPVVHNKAFQAFNELGELTPGASIVVYSDTHMFEYTVETVRLARADEVVIRFDADEPILTLSTCNTFGAKQERWVATATLTRTSPIGMEN
ncbi:MAG: sortase [Candidatus Pacebacteria bacterium]|nr:sortase [Candidatus Paceibacterota bacterium]